MTNYMGHTEYFYGYLACHSTLKVGALKMGAFVVSALIAGALMVGALKMSALKLACIEVIASNVNLTFDAIALMHAV